MERFINNKMGLFLMANNNKFANSRDVLGMANSIKNVEEIASTVISSASFSRARKMYDQLTPVYQEAWGLAAMETSKGCTRGSLKWDAEYRKDFANRFVRIANTLWPKEE